MRQFPNMEDKWDAEDVSRINAEPWMLELLKLNPEYTSWGPHEDYMTKEGHGWDSRQIRATWSDFGPWQLDDLNECVNFYFEVDRATIPCAACGQTGYNPATKKIADAFYAHEGPGPRWVHSITQDEVQTLVDAGRLTDFTHTFVAGEGWQPKDPPVCPTASEVNAWSAGRGLGHDAINRGILIETRAKRLGVYGSCPECDGHGSVFTEPAAHVSLTLWWLHPRKGCSRGVEVSSIERSDLPAVFAFLREAAARNAARFARVVAL